MIGKKVSMLFLLKIIERESNSEQKRWLFLVAVIGISPCHYGWQDSSPGMELRNPIPTQRDDYHYFQEKKIVNLNIINRIKKEREREAFF